MENLNVILQELRKWEAVIACLFIFSFFVAFSIICWKKPEKRSKILVKAPVFLTTLAILGTFVGVGLGLLNFDSGNVEKSVPELIDGIKMAFWVSAFGIFCALVFKFCMIIGDMRSRPTAHDLPHPESYDEAILTVLNKIQEGIAQQNQTSLLNGIKEEINHHRLESRNHLQSLSSSFDKFLQNAMENSSKQLVDALQRVMDSFNEKINDQLGEAFQQFNEATKNLAKWQEQNKDHLEILTQQNVVITGTMTKAVENYEATVIQSEKFSLVAENLQNLLEGLETQKQSLSESMIQFAGLVHQTAKAFPQIETHITEIAEQTHRSMEAMHEKLTDTTNKLLEGYTNNLNQATENSQRLMSNSQTEFSKVIGDSHKAIQNNIETVNKTIDDTTKQVREMVDNSKKQNDYLNEQLAIWMENSLTKLGDNLASLSNKFASDYTPLTEKLRDVVNLARNLP